jgi:prepilin-type processing-associated H-X9-DG protein
MLLPALGRAKLKAQGIQCMNNGRQLMLAWQMYVDDNHGSFPPNLSTASEANDFTTPGWVKGWLDYSGGIADTNLDFLVSPPALVGPYARSPKVFKCPADPACANGSTGPQRVRSCSMNQAFRSGTEQWQSDHLGTNTYLVYTKETGLMNPGPANLFVIVDEHPDSINDGGFAVQMPASAQATSWVDLPAKYHGDACGFTFADGHSEIHKWINAGIIPAVTYQAKDPNSTIYLLRNADVQWVAKHTSARIDGAALPY